MPIQDFPLELISDFVPYDSGAALDSASRLRAAGHSPEAVSFILNQAKLRTRARAKVGERADSMLLTEAGLEQATRTAVASYHAQRFVAAGIGSVADLGCGLGFDSLAFAAAGLSTVSVEIDPETAAFTDYNLRDFPASRVICDDAQALAPQDLKDDAGVPVAALWLDPARREVEGKKTTSRLFDPEAFAPPFSHVLKLAATGIPLAVKMGPGLPHEVIPENCEAQWVSHGGSVVEVVLWFNALARPGIKRSALLLAPDPLQPQVLCELVSEEPESDPAETAELADFLFEPNGAVVRSHLVADLARLTGTYLLDERIAYLTSDRPVSHPALAGFRVLATMPIHEKTLKRWVKEEGIGTLTIKKRGVDISPEELRKKLLAGGKKKGKKSATLILTRLGEGRDSRRVAIHAEPLE